jgi:hypothetical protein
MRADQALGLAEPRGWNRRSCGAGAKGPRYYDWAWVATDRPRRQLLIRRSITDPNEIAYFYAYAPEGHVCSLTDLVKIAGTRWKGGGRFPRLKIHRLTRPDTGQVLPSLETPRHPGHCESLSAIDVPTPPPWSARRAA